MHTAGKPQERCFIVASILSKANLKSSAHSCVARGVLQAFEEVPKPSSNGTHTEGTAHVIKNPIRTRFSSVVDAGAPGLRIDIRRCHIEALSPAVSLVRLLPRA